MSKEVSLPGVPKVPYDPPEPDDYFPSVFPSSPASSGGANPRGESRASQAKPLMGGATIDDGGLLALDYRAVGEVNERAYETRKRALHGTLFGGGGSTGAIQASGVARQDDPLSDETVKQALGWLLNLETKDPGLRLLSIKREVMAAVGLLYRDTAGAKWGPRTWPEAHPKTGDKSLGGLAVSALGTVTGLELPGNNLVGVLPRDMTKGMPALKVVDLSGNRGLGGALPGTIANLPLCTRLDLTGCAFEGPLPPQLSFMGSLRQLLLADNGFTGGLLPRLVDCAKLEHVDLSGNALDGALPRAWGRFQALRVLRLARNRCAGSVPDAWAELAGLEELELAWP